MDVGPQVVRRALQARDVGLNGTTSFGIIVAVAFAGLVLISTFSLQAYRRVTRELQVTNPSLLPSEFPEEVTCPKLWDMSVALRNEADGRGDWEKTLVSSEASLRLSCRKG